MPTWVSVVVGAGCAWLAFACGCGGNGDDDDDAPSGSPQGGSTAVMQPASGGSSGGAASAAGSGASGSGSTSTPMGSDAGTAADAGATAGDAGPGADAAPAATEIDCTPRAIAGDATMHFHHVHFNTTAADQDLELFEKLFATETIEWCKDKKTGAATWATKTDRGYFLYTEVDVAPDPALNTYLEHVGWLHPTPNMELARLIALDAPLWESGHRFQCPEAAMGTMACGFDGYWFYLKAPSGARIEIARGPGPATMGFGHVHMIMGADLAWLETVTGGAYKDGAIDMVNHTAISLEETLLDTEMKTETRGKPIDHIGYSTTELEAARDRIMGAGITLAEEISWKPAFGFRSFMVKDAKGIWYEIVEDTAFAP
jgi:hypothetical protein